SKSGNTIRQLKRFADGMKLTSKDRYWLWASFMNEKDAEDLFNKPAFADKYITGEFISRKNKILQFINNDKSGSMNEILYTDMQLVLPNDMLAKVDSMSMANSLEVRTPFLDY